MLYEDASEVLDQAETAFNDMLVRLEHEQLPEFDTDIETLV